MRTSYGTDGTVLEIDTEGATTVNVNLYNKLKGLLSRRQRILEGHDKVNYDRGEKTHYTWAELRIHLPEVEAEIIQTAHALVAWSEVERNLGAHDPRFQPVSSHEELHEQADKLKTTSPYLAER